MPINLTNMHRFMKSFKAVLSMHFLVKCRNIILLTCLTLSWHTLIIFRIYVIETKLDFVSFDDKNLQRRRKFRTCLSHTKFLY